VSYGGANDRKMFKNVVSLRFLVSVQPISTNPARPVIRNSGISLRSLPSIAKRFSASFALSAQHGVMLDAENLGGAFGFDERVVVSSIAKSVRLPRSTRTQTRLNDPRRAIRADSWVSRPSWDVDHVDVGVDKIHWHSPWSRSVSGLGSCVSRWWYINIDGRSDLCVLAGESKKRGGVSRGNRKWSTGDR